MKVTVHVCRVWQVRLTNITLRIVTVGRWNRVSLRRTLLKAHLSIQCRHYRRARRATKHSYHNVHIKSNLVLPSFWTTVTIALSVRSRLRRLTNNEPIALKVTSTGARWSRIRSHTRTYAPHGRTHSLSVWSLSPFVSVASDFAQSTIKSRHWNAALRSVYSRKSQEPVLLL